MIRAQEILKLIEAWDVKKFPGFASVHYSHNPSSLSEVLRDLKDDIKRFGIRYWRESPVLRFSYDATSDELLVWIYDRSTHIGMEDKDRPTDYVRGFINAGKKNYYVEMYFPDRSPRKWQCAKEEYLPDSLFRFFRDLKWERNNLRVTDTDEMADWAEKQSPLGPAY
jgi:hypothetical protein